MTNKKTDAARLLSMEEDEIFDVASKGDATYVRTLDGNVVVITEGGDGNHDVALLVKPRPTFHGFPVAYPGLSEAEALKQVGVKLDDPRPRPADPSIPEGTPEDAFVSPGDEAATAAALAGASAADSTVPVDAPGPEHAASVEESADAGTAEREQDVVEKAQEKAEPDKPARRGRS